MFQQPDQLLGRPGADRGGARLHLGNGIGIGDQPFRNPPLDIRSLIVFAALAIAGIVVAVSSQFVMSESQQNIMIAIGSAIFGTLVFLFGCAFGLAVASPLAFAVALSPLTLFRSKARRKHVAIDWQRATNKLQGGSWSKIVRFSFYAFFFLLFCLFFSQAMYRTPAGIYTGASQNLGDLAFHLGAIFGFTDGGNFPPQNPSFAGAKFSYPFIADVVTAAFTKLRVDVESAVFVQDVAWAFSLFIILERLVLSLTRDRFAGKLAPWLLFFSGGLGFVWFLSDYWHQGKC